VHANVERDWGKWLEITTTDDFSTIRVKTCSTCGNEIDSNAWRCPHCESLQTESSEPRRKPKRKIRDVNLEKGHPTVEEAISRLDSAIVEARDDGIKILRLIHGWGSSGKPSKIKPAVRRHLGQLRRQSGIAKFVSGDEFSELTVSGRQLLSDHPILRKSLQTDTNNPGITFVEI